MQWLWTWGGECFGYRDRDGLWTHYGFHVGQFHGDEVFGPDGRYLGELRHENRLITHRARLATAISGFAPLPQRIAYAPSERAATYVLYEGYEDFPGADMFLRTSFPSSA
jgi:hypothetical protein